MNHNEKNPIFRYDIGVLFLEILSLSEVLWLGWLLLDVITIHAENTEGAEV